MSPRAGGFDFATDPINDALDFTPFWRAENAPAVVTLLTPAPARFRSTFTLSTLAPIATRHADDGLYLRLSDGRQLLILGAPKPDEPLAFLLPADADLQTRWRAAAGAFSPGRPVDPLTPEQRRRHVLALRALDGREEGASEREIAGVLFDSRDLPRGAAWKADDLRARTLRLIASARERVRGGYLRLLRLQPPKRRRS